MSIEELLARLEFRYAPYTQPCVYCDGVGQRYWPEAGMGHCPYCQGTGQFTHASRDPDVLALIRHLRHEETP